MKFSTAVFGVATLVGVGYVVGRKVFEKKKDDAPSEEEPRVFVKESYKDKLRKGGLFAVGAIKTGADKAAETIKDIRTKDMVKKGEETVGAVKEASENIKKDIEDLKNMVSSINEEEAGKADDLFEEPSGNAFDKTADDLFKNE
ncbi:MAG: hypothetical protein LBI36_06315 [Oscillospiraceae bacterium]|jgi:peptidoglycan hydrolase CwlO-like protein|nr:hypothetical protein [Oscillospiraceae bacterium]